MALGLVGEKCGMTRVFTDAGESIPVTVIMVSPNTVTQVKNAETDGYRAVQVVSGERKRNRINKATSGVLAKAGVETGRHFKEFRLDEDEGAELEPGAELSVTMFEAGQYVDVSGVSKGKGFQGSIKRHNFRSQDATHGNSISHRAPGSTGQCQTPGRVFKGKRMAGHMGNANCTVQNLEVVRVDEERRLVLLRGAVPGAKGSQVVLRPTTRKH